ncbi:hypothetical protein [Bifidobacterium avesanii]|uniref:SPOR domain-containing protein n=1 Tax=Bifidobacterium avesanii TaxID=1798157 RepID=A0A7K3TH84_9BIFI|nr:hypothetical protein [Bifidobacterium avesanii]KAB8292854.1 hypothetical protein DSM100685_0865 [Bifidobacterium avesanii]NEG78458.1 hypothetical protein [Bifidobacterium avesanii]
MADKQWYFNTVTGEPELGKISPISRRMGPYVSREEALKAWDIVRERNRRWERQDADWRGERPEGGEPDSNDGNA